MKRKALWSVLGILYFLYIISLTGVESIYSKTDSFPVVVSEAELITKENYPGENRLVVSRSGESALVGLGVKPPLLAEVSRVAASLPEDLVTASSVPEPGLAESQLYAKGAVLLDGDSGRVLYGKNAEEQMPMASTTKIMTCILVLELADVQEQAVASSYAASMPAVHLGVRKGESYSVQDLLYSLMLESHNDTAVVLAEHVGNRLLGRSEKSPADCTREESLQAVAAFAGAMNEKAREIGCENTWFITPNGLDATEQVEVNGEQQTKVHSTTATDLARIMRYCLYGSEKSNTFLAVTGKAAHSFSANGRSFSLQNHNALLTMMNGVISGKTGFTGNAGYCYVGALERDGKKLIVALLACGWPNNKTYKWADSRKLLDYGLKEFSMVSASDACFFYEKQLPQVLVLNGGTENLEEQCLSELQLVEGEPMVSGILLRKGEEIATEFRCQEVLEAPVEAGQCVGEIIYSLNGQILKRDELQLAQGFQRIDYKWCLEKVLELYMEPGGPSYAE